MTPFACSHCGNTVYFENTDCGRCGAVLGFVPGQRRMLSFALPSAGEPDDSDAAGSWQILHGIDAQGAGAKAGDPATAATGGRTPSAAARDEGGAEAGDGQAEPGLQPCDNRRQHQVCNWMLDAGDPGPLCISCRLTGVIPSLADGQNLAHWAAIERAKRHLVHTLMGLGLTPRPIGSDRAARGLRFQLLEALPGGPPVMTGHEDGVITLNIAEADDVHRETTRVAMGEPVRTLLGHLRHEVSHYLAWRHLEDTPAMDRCREAFGDERVDYAAALQTHYAQGAPADWSQRYVSAYASAHPYEDWAETCAHYLLVVDAMETASAWGLQLEGPSPTRATEAADLRQPLAERVLAHWLPLAQFLNAMNRSLGQPDSYPFLLPPQVLDKMNLVQSLLAEAGAREAEAQASTPEAQTTETGAATP
jgi:hypothetical protein